MLILVLQQLSFLLLFSFSQQRFIVFIQQFPHLLFCIPALPDELVLTLLQGEHHQYPSLSLLVLVSVPFDVKLPASCFS